MTIHDTEEENSNLNPFQSRDYYSDKDAANNILLEYHTQNEDLTNSTMVHLDAHWLAELNTDKLYLKVLCTG